MESDHPAALVINSGLEDMRLRQQGHGMMGRGIYRLEPCGCEVDPPVQNPRA